MKSLEPNSTYGILCFTKIFNLTYGQTQTREKVICRGQAAGELRYSPDQSMANLNILDPQALPI